MIKLSVLYPAGDGTTFDMHYYKTTHMDLVRRSLNPARIEIDEGEDGQPFMAIGHLYFDSPDALQQGMAHPDAGATQEDIPNFTNVTPQIQMSTVIE